MSTNYPTWAETGSKPAGPADRIGQRLAQCVRLTRHDVDEILVEQAVTRKRFGQIALQWGLCAPADVWQAWTAQVIGRTPRVDLAKLGIDAQAVADLPAELAAALGVVPVRSTPDRLVVAATEQTLARAAERLPTVAGKPVTFVLADAAQVEAAVRRYYAAALEAAARPACAGKRCGSNCKGDACPARHAARADRMTRVA